MKVLLVEDDLVSCKVLESILSKYGETDMALDGQAAVEMAVAALEIGKPYDVIFLDLQMPRKDGLTALAEIRGQEVGRASKSRIIILSGNIDADVLVQADDLGADACFSKPIDREAIEHKLNDFKLSA